MGKIQACLLAAVLGAIVGGAAALIGGCGGDETCKPGLEPIAPGICRVPGGSQEMQAGRTTPVTGGQPGGITPPPSRAGAGGRGGTGGQGGTGGNDGLQTGMSGRVEPQNAGGADAAGGGARGRSDSGAGGGGAGQGGHGGAGSGGMHEASGGAGAGGFGGSGGQGGTGGEPDEPAMTPPTQPVGGQVSEPPPTPKAGMMAPPPPKHFCGDGTVDSGETCDGDCPTTCDDQDPCTKDTQVGSVNLCNVACKHEPIMKPGGHDGCCPDGADATNDDDCEPLCGNGVKETGEECDGDCPTTCTGNPNPCTRESLTGTGCARHCVSTPLPAGTICGNGKCTAAGVCEFQTVGSGTWYGSCAETADCPSGAVCLDSICTTSCTAAMGTIACHTPNAGFNSMCIGGVCYQGNCSGTTVDSDTNCPSGQWCAQSASDLRFCSPKP